MAGSLLALSLIRFVHPNFTCGAFAFLACGGTPAVNCDLAPALWPAEPRALQHRDPANRSCHQAILPPKSRPGPPYHHGLTAATFLAPTTLGLQHLGHPNR